MRTQFTGHRLNASPYHGSPSRSKRTTSLVKARFGPMAAAQQVRRTGQPVY